MPPIARYSLLRVLLFAAVLSVMVALGARGLLLLVGALVISALLSYVLLNGPRAAVVQRLQERTAQRHAAATRPGGRRRSAADLDAEAEDGDDGHR